MYPAYSAVSCTWLQRRTESVRLYMAACVRMSIFGGAHIGRCMPRQATNVYVGDVNSCTPAALV